MLDSDHPRDRLLAILSADGVGYSRLMALDQHRTVAALDAARGVFRTHIEAHGGRVIDMAGDSVLAVFESAVSAMKAALAAQAEQTVLLAAITADERLMHRIGIHLGEIIEKHDGSVYGDGVNIASRLEGLALPGGIVVSQAVHEVVARRVTAGFLDLGPQVVKNISQPVRAYRVEGETTQDDARPRRTGLRVGIALASAAGILIAALVGGWWRFGPHPSLPFTTPPAAKELDAGPLSIVVLPFANLTGEEAQAYIADGLTVSITSDLSRIRDAFVVSANSAQAFRNKAVTVQQVGKDLGVRFVLQGSVQRDAQKLRVNVQLADARSNAQLWSESFDGDGRDLFAFQDRITTLIGNSMDRELVVRAARDSGAVYTNPKLVDLLLQARAMNIKPPSLEGTLATEALFRQALKIDASNVDARIGLARTLYLECLNFFTSFDRRDRDAKFAEAGKLCTGLSAEHLEDPRVYDLQSTLLETQGDPEGALRAAERALELAPKDPGRYAGVANLLYWRARPSRALALLNQAIALDPKNPAHSTLVNLSWVEFMLGHYDQAIEWGLKAKGINPNRYVVDENLAAAYAMKGDRVRARAVIAAELKIDPKASISRLLDESNGPPYDPAFKAFLTKSLVPALRLAGLPE